MNEQNQKKTSFQSAYRKNDNFEIDIKQLWAIFVARWKFILLIAIVCGAATFAYNKLFVTPMYAANATILIQSNDKTEGTITPYDLSISYSLIEDFVTIATSRTTLKMVNEEVSTSGASISASAVENTSIIRITVKHADPDKAAKIADAVATATSKRISEVMDIPDMVREVDKAASYGPISPNVTKSTGIAFALGLLAAYIFFAIIFLSNDKINTAEDVDKYIGEAVLGTIPIYDPKIK